MGGRGADGKSTAPCRAEEVRRQNPPRPERPPGEMNRAADGVSGAAEFPLPEAVADHRHGPIRAAAASIVSGRQRATEQRTHAERLKERAARPEPVNDRCFSAGTQIEPGE